MYRRPFIFFLVFFLFNFTQVNGQKRNNVWLFGDHTGLDFNSTPPAVLKKSAVSFQSTPYYVSSICDSSGNLIFYTDGATVWNWHNDVIPKYLSRWPWTGHVMPLICPYPGNDSLYYVFGVSDGSYANRLQYITVNMKGDGGKGEIVYPQPSTVRNYYTILLTNASVLVTGTAHCNGKDTWIVAHSGNSLYSFLVTAKGVDTVPVVSAISPDIISPGYIDGALGNMKFSANAEKMVIPVKNEQKMVVLQFNNATGNFGNPVSLHLQPNLDLDDVELSPDGSKLYYGAYETSTGDEIYVELHDVFQMDLTAGAEDDILQTIIKLTPHSDRQVCSPNLCIYVYRTLQLTPVGKIYISMRYADSPANFDVRLSVIENPNEAGASCFYRANAIDMGNKYGMISYNYIRSQTFTPKDKGIQVQDSTCADKPVSFSLLYTHVDSVKWDFGDASSGSNNFSGLLNPQHTYPSPGTYIAKAIIYKTCFADTAIKEFTISQDLSVRIADSIRDAAVCTGDTLQLNGTTAHATGYMWSTGLIYPNISIIAEGAYSLNVYNACSSDRREFYVKYSDCPCNIFVPNAFTPNDDRLNDALKPMFYCSVKQMRFAVYNRYGENVFTTTKKGEGWNGYTGSSPAAAGTYVWMLQYRNPNNKQLYQQRGSVLLIR